MTIPGIITTVGLVVSFFMLQIWRINYRIRGAWICLFSLFVLVNVTHFAGVSNAVHDLVYMVPAMICGIATIHLFAGAVCNCTALYVAGFAFNVLGNYFGADQFKVWSVDFLDVVVWSQIVLLFLMARHYPVGRWNARRKNVESGAREHMNKVICHDREFSFARGYPHHLD